MGLIVNSSPRLVQKYTEILAANLSDNVQQMQSHHVSELLAPLTMSQPKFVLDKFIPLLKKKLLAAKSNEKHQDKFLHQLVKSTNIKDQFDQFELKIVNKEGLIWYLNILLDVISFSSPELVAYANDIELITLHSMLHEDLTVFNKSVEVFHRLILSLTGVYPTNVSIIDFKTNKLDQQFRFYDRVGKSSSSNIKVEWK